MSEQTENIRLMLSNLMCECSDYTIKTLNNLCELDTHASMRAVILPLLAKTWEKTPFPMGIPKEINKLVRYADKHNLFVYHAGKLVDVLLIIKGENTRNNQNLN